MNIVFIHQNFPGQFRHIANQLAQSADNKVIVICQDYAPKLPQIDTLIYKPLIPPAQSVHQYLDSTQRYVLNGQGVVQALLKLQQMQFKPDVIVAHTGWGEALYVKQVFPEVPLVGFFEFFYHTQGADVGFDPEQPATLDDKLRVITRNSIHLLSLQAADVGITPTHWQRSVFPKEYQPKLNIIHEGVNVDLAKPDPNACIVLENGLRLTPADEVITYVSRNLEPYRGFHVFMRAAAEICQRRPNVHIIIVGGDEVSYGMRLPKGQTYRNKMLAEVNIDNSRVHFVGRIPYQLYLQVLQVSAAHVYLTVPFVLSWSMLEAMAAECLVIGSDTAPVKEVIIDGVNGLLVDFFSPTAIADAVDAALDNRAAMLPLRQAARTAVVNAYTHQMGIAHYQSLLSKLIKPVC